MLEIKRDTDIREVASLLGMDLKTAAELITTCLLYEATWKLCPEKAVSAVSVLVKYKPSSSHPLKVEKFVGLAPLYIEEESTFAYRYYYIIVNKVALVRDRKEHRWLIAELGEIV